MSDYKTKKQYDKDGKELKLQIAFSPSKGWKKPVGMNVYLIPGRTLIGYIYYATEHEEYVFKANGQHFKQLTENSLKTLHDVIKSANENLCEYRQYKLKLDKKEKE